VVGSASKRRYWDSASRITTFHTPGSDVADVAGGIRRCQRGGWSCTASFSRASGGARTGLALCHRRPGCKPGQRDCFSVGQRLAPAFFRSVPHRSWPIDEHDRGRAGCSRCADWAGRWALDVYVKPRGNASCVSMLAPSSSTSRARHFTSRCGRPWSADLQMKSGLVEVLAPHTVPSRSAGTSPWNSTPNLRAPWRRRVLRRPVSPLLLPAR